MSEHPGIVSRPGPTRRRATLASGPDMREAARAVKSARSTEPDQADDRLPGLITDNTGTPLRLIRIAVRYWASYPRRSTASQAITQRDCPRQRNTHALPPICMVAAGRLWR